MNFSSAFSSLLGGVALAVIMFMTNAACSSQRMISVTCPKHKGKKIKVIRNNKVSYNTKPQGFTGLSVDSAQASASFKLNKKIIEMPYARHLYYGKF